jgi:predicted transcriptional regulator of viral defense system
MKDMEEKTCSLEELEDLFDLSKRRIQQLASEGWIPRVMKGHYNLDQCVRGYLNYLRESIIQNKFR